MNHPALITKANIPSESSQFSTQNRFTDEFTGIGNPVVFSPTVKRKTRGSRDSLTGLFVSPVKRNPHRISRRTEKMAEYQQQMKESGRFEFSDVDDATITENEDRMDEADNELKSLS